MKIILFFITALTLLSEPLIDPTSEPNPLYDLLIGWETGEYCPDGYGGHFADGNTDIIALVNNDEQVKAAIEAVIMRKQSVEYVNVKYSYKQLLDTYEQLTDIYFRNGGDYSGLIIISASITFNRVEVGVLEETFDYWVEEMSQYGDIVQVEESLEIITMERSGRTTPRMVIRLLLEYTCNYIKQWLPSFLYLFTGVFVYKCLKLKYRE